MANLKIIKAIINYLKKETERPDVSSDTKESLEVAVQCLQNAYDIDPSQDLTSDALPFSIEELFKVSCLPLESDDLSQAEKLHKAEMMKNLGNNLMKNNQFVEALRYYTAAIDLDSQNAIYYGNRAAAYSKLKDFEKALKDCEKAIEIDPKYAKAYGRMGLAYVCLKQEDLAIQAFKKAVELDPSNDSYQTNLKIAEEKKERAASPIGEGLAGLSSIDWQALFSNPEYRTMASSVMQDPNIIGALSSLTQNSPPTRMNDLGSGSVPNAGSNRNLDVLFEASQYLATQMQATNPDLVEQLRQTASRTFNPPNQDN